MKMKKIEPTRQEILNVIRDCFQQIYQWYRPANVDHGEIMIKYQHQADALIKLLEVCDTGFYLEHTGNLWERFIKLYNKYADIKDKKIGDVYSFKELNNFFKGDIYGDKNTET